MKLPPKKIKDIVDKHGKWLRGEEGGERANLVGANLWRADLGGADLWRADLGGAHLAGADLGGADLEGATGNMREVVSMHVDTWPICIDTVNGVMQIGCERHAVADWFSFDDDRIAAMDRLALDWWRTWRPVIKGVWGRVRRTETDTQAETAP